MEGLGEGGGRERGGRRRGEERRGRGRSRGKSRERRAGRGRERGRGRGGRGGGRGSHLLPKVPCKRGLLSLYIRLVRVRKHPLGENPSTKLVLQNIRGERELTGTGSTTHYWQAKNRAQGSLSPESAQAIATCCTPTFLERMSLSPRLTHGLSR